MEIRMRPATMRLTAVIDSSSAKFTPKHLGIAACIKQLGAGCPSQHFGHTEAIFFVPVVQ
jgi:hypothetical protein